MNQEEREYVEKNNLCPVCYWKKHDGETTWLFGPFFCDGTKRFMDPDRLQAMINDLRKEPSE